jgi:hypothetical protein
MKQTLETSIETFLFEDMGLTPDKMQELPFEADPNAFFTTDKEKESNKPERVKYLFTGKIDLTKFLAAFGLDTSDIAPEELETFKNGRLFGDLVQHTITKHLNKTHEDFKGATTATANNDDYDMIVQLGTENRKIEIRLFTNAGVMRVQPSKLAKQAYSGEEDSHKEKGLFFNTLRKIKGSYGYIFADIRNFQNSNSLIGTYDVYLVLSDYLYDLGLRGFFGKKGEKSFWKKDVREEEGRDKLLKKFFTGTLEPTDISKEKNTEAKKVLFDKVEQDIDYLDKQIDKAKEELIQYKNYKEIQNVYFKITGERNIARSNEQIEKIITRIAKAFEKEITGNSQLQTKFSQREINIMKNWTPVLKKRLEDFLSYKSQKAKYLSNFHDAVGFQKGKMSIPARKQRKNPQTAAPTPDVSNLEEQKKENTTLLDDIFSIEIPFNLQQLLF